MKILFSLVLLALISCGGKTGGGSGVTSSSYQQANFGKNQPFGTLVQFKNLVANDQWGQDPRLAYYNYNTFTFYYRTPPSSSSGDCHNYGSGGIFSFSFCLDLNTQQTTPTITWTTEENKGVITKPLVELSKIKDLVYRAVPPNPNGGINPSGPNAFFNSTNGQWIIINGNETLVFSPLYPLGGNPTYYKNASGTEYSLFNFIPKSLP